MIFLDYLFIFPLLFHHFWFSLFFTIMLIYETSARFSFHFSNIQPHFFFPRYIWLRMVITKRKYFYFILLHTFSFFLVSLSPYRYTGCFIFILSPLLLLLPSFIFQDENNFLTYNHSMLFKGYFYFDNYE